MYLPCLKLTEPFEIFFILKLGTKAKLYKHAQVKNNTIKVLAKQPSLKLLPRLKSVHLHLVKSLTKFFQANGLKGFKVYTYLLYLRSLPFWSRRLVSGESNHGLVPKYPQFGDFVAG